MLELMLCSMLTILPDYLFRRFAQGKRLGYEISFFTVWYELRWGITLCLILTISLITLIFYFPPVDQERGLVFPDHSDPAGGHRPRDGGVGKLRETVKAGNRCSSSTAASRKQPLRRRAGASPRWMQRFGAGESRA